MQKINIVLISVMITVVTFGTLLFSCGEALADRTSYALVCKGGGTMKAEFAMPHTYKTSGPQIIIYPFKRSKTPASAQQPEAGSCAWTDRTFRDDEPISIHYVTSNPGLNFIIFKAGGVERWGMNEQSMYITDAVTQGKVFYLRVYRDKDHFVATHVGP